MRIAYVALHLNNETMEGGVGGKIRSQIRLWRDMGHEARLFLLSPDQVVSTEIRTFTFRPGTKLPVLKFLTREISRSVALARLIRAIEAFRPDIIYLRYGLFAYPLQRLFDIAPIVIELNTNDVAEYRYRGLFFYWANRLTRGIILKQAAGFVASTYEIRTFPFNKYGKPCQVIANGIDLDRYAPCAAPANYPPVIVFAGTPGFNWHGVDKLYEMARLCPDLRVEIIGYVFEDLNITVPENVKLHGLVHQDQVKTILTAADIACGTLALYRKNMQEACPLKVREYLACGLPTILAYQDTDLCDLEADFLLRLPNVESNVIDNVKLIRDFAYRMRGRRVNRELINPRINQRQKEETRLTFFQQILRVSKGNT